MTDATVPSIAERYHEATKYTPEGVASSSHHLDWSKKPKLWKTYPGAARVPLFPALLGRDTARVSIDELAAALATRTPPAGPFRLKDLAKLLYLTNGVTRVVPAPAPAEEPFLMRAAPSAGGLYPTEVYVVSGVELAGLPQGAWNLSVPDLSLVATRAPGDGATALDLVAQATAVEDLVRKAEIVVVLTAIFERSGWRYEERAYRRVLLDTGHVLGNLVLAAGLAGRVAVPIGGFVDRLVEEALGLRGDAPAEEGALLVVPVLKAEDADPRPPRGSLALRGKVVPAAFADVSRGLMRALHTATRIEPPIERAYGRDRPGDAYLERAEGTLVHLPERSIDWASEAAPTILRRRSTRRFSAEPFSLEELATVLGSAYPGPKDRATAFVDPSLLETSVLVARSGDAEPAVYRFDPRDRTLRVVVPGGLSDEASTVCLGQELARDAAAVVFHTVDFPRAIARYGDRAYRYVHLDAGHLGERLDLAALALGLGASGIGGFFDDQANELLGLPPREAIVYLTTLGRPASEPEEEG